MKRYKKHRALGVSEAVCDRTTDALYFKAHVINFRLSKNSVERMLI